MGMDCGGPGRDVFSFGRKGTKKEEEEEEDSMQIYREMVAKLRVLLPDGSGGRPYCSRPLLNCACRCGREW